MRNDSAPVAGCMRNASLIEDLRAMIEQAGFTDVGIEPEDESQEFIRDWAPCTNVTDYVDPATIVGIMLEKRLLLLTTRSPWPRNALR